MTGLAALAASRHRFEDARALAEQAIRLNPRSAEAYGVLGDALVELGRYRDAFARFDRMAGSGPRSPPTRGSPTPASCSAGRAGAIAAMRLAVKAGAGTGEPAAVVAGPARNLYFDTGRLAPAERATDRRSLASRATSTPRLRSAGGRRARALRRRSPSLKRRGREAPAAAV